MAADRHALRQESLRVLGECIFSSDVLTFAGNGEIFTFAAKKILCLLQGQDESGLVFFYTSAALYKIYRSIIGRRVRGKTVVDEKNSERLELLTCHGFFPADVQEAHRKFQRSVRCSRKV